ncbi:hypothetical protein QBC45DRAFT_391560 [Copromyces sp. CBS 386.78]|nr:hypothetical protein QBC45DRAFT_391560 [Copromyces sp. CBS 386.78]
MTSEAIPPILAAPLEIRHAIYRYVWTITFREHTDYVQDVNSHCHFLCQVVVFFRLQAKRLYKLVSICQQMKYEVLSEYFHRSQIYIRTSMSASWSIRQPYVHSSALFTSHTQHVILHVYRGFHDQIKSLDWLLQLKQLKTLEMVVTDWRLYRDTNVQDNVAAIINELFGPRQMKRLTALRNLDKIRVKLRFRRPNSDRNTKIAEGTPEFQRLKRILSESVREDLRQSEHQPTYKFEQQIGVHWFE